MGFTGKFALPSAAPCRIGQHHWRPQALESPRGAKYDLRPNMTRTLIATLLLPIAGLAAPSPEFKEVADYPGKNGKPVAPLVEGRTGGIFGIFQEPPPIGGKTQPGGLFRLKEDRTVVLHRFIGNEGLAPISLIAGQDGFLYGTCSEGGEFQEGTIWSFDPARRVFKKLTDVPLDAGPAFVDGVKADGTLYGRFKGQLFNCSRSGELTFVFDFSSLALSWAGGDIGSVGVAGSASGSSGTFTVKGSGADISSTTDAFHFFAQALTGNGDGEIRARVTSQTNTDSSAKAGVMIRDGTGASAKHAMMVITPGNGFAFEYRTVAGGPSSHVSGPALNAVPNNWVRLTRSGTLFTAYVSADGNIWTEVGTATISMSATVKVGLAVTSHSNSVLSTATFDNVSIVSKKNPSDSFAITLGSDGNYYGTTPDGSVVPTGSGDLGAGLFYRVNVEGSEPSYEDLVAFSETTGRPPVRIMEGSDGAFYGISEKTNGMGHQPLLLKITPTQISTAYDFGVTFVGEINREVFRGPDNAIYLEVSRATLTSTDPSDLLVRFNEIGSTASPVFTNTDIQKRKFFMLASDGNVYGSIEQSNARGDITRVSGLDLGPFDRPPYARPDLVTIPVGATSVTFLPLKNDGDPDKEDLLSVVSIDPAPENGLADFDPVSNRFTYTPESVTTLSDSFTYTIQDKSGKTASARVRIVRAGPSRNYAGELTFHVMPAYCRATITNAGQLTGVIQTLGRRIPLRITLSADRQGEIESKVILPADDNPAHDKELSLKFTLKETLPAGSDAGGKLSVTLKSDTNTTEETFDESPREPKADPQYTVTMPPVDPMADSGIEPDPTKVQITDVPAKRSSMLGGAGWATMTVSATGNARLVGKLADGSAISFGGPFSKDTTLPIYITCSPQLQLIPAPPRGFFAGTLDFGSGQPDQSDADCSGVFRWTRPWSETGIFKLGFAIRQPIAGFVYSRPGGSANPSRSPVELPVKLLINGPSGIPLAKTTGTTKGADFNFPSFNASFKVFGRDGTVTGTLKHPALPFPSPASGILIRKLNQLIGFYKTPAGTGQFVVKPE
jgi:regulation of enolase protein 1 (concanavalin A-like superfamily)